MPWEYTTSARMNDNQPGKYIADHLQEPQTGGRDYLGSVFMECKTVAYATPASPGFPATNSRNPNLPKGHNRKATVEYVHAWVFTANASARSQVAILLRLWYT